MFIVAASSLRRFVAASSIRCQRFWANQGVTRRVGSFVYSSSRQRRRIYLAALDLRVQKLQLDALGDHVPTCTGHSGAKKAHDWAVEQLADLFHTSTKAKTT